MTHPSDRRSRIFKGFALSAALGVGALAAVACTEAVTGPSDVTGGVWTLLSMQKTGSTTPFVPDDPTKFTVEFRDDGFVGVRADCNSCGGTYTLAGDQLTVGSLSCTLALCATPNGGEFAAIVDGTTTLGKDGQDTLVVQSGEGRLILKR